jgi:hypothetical protein
LEEENMTKMNKWLFQISLLFLAVYTTTSQAAAQGVSGGGPPVVAITDVVEISKDNVLIDVPGRSFRVQWSTQKPPLTTILGYGASLEVRFADGAIRTASQDLGPTATSAKLAFPQSAARAVEFKALVKTTFKTPAPGSVTTTREFDLTTDAFQGGVGSGGPLPPNQPKVQIASATQIDFKTFKIEWNVQSAPGISIERFDASALVTYRTGDPRPGGAAPTTTLQTPVSPTTGSQRQTNVVVNNAPIRFPAIRIKATLETKFNLPVESTIQSTKQGLF